MDFTSAIKKSIANFLEGKVPESLLELKEGELIYTPEYFDALEEDFNLVPVIGQLNETIQLNNNVFRTTPKAKNIIFKAE